MLTFFHWIKQISLFKFLKKSIVARTVFLSSAESSGSEAHDQLQQRLAEITSLSGELAAAKDKIAFYSKVQEIRTIVVIKRYLLLAFSITTTRVPKTLFLTCIPYSTTYRN
jgi:hypothetical protein